MIQAIPLPISPAAPSPSLPSRGVQPMNRDDLLDVANLFNQVFRRKSEAPSRDLMDYLDRLFFQAPSYAPEHGALVHRNATGRIDSALLALPMPFQIGDTKITARLLCAFMADGRSGLSGAARLARAIRLSQPEFCFSDNSSPTSADHWTTAGGRMLPVQSLEWRRTFRPVASAMEQAGARMPWLNRLPLSSLANVPDTAIRRLMPSFKSPRHGTGYWAPAGTDKFFHCFQTMTRHFSLRPAWSSEDVQWLMESAALNRTQGVLTCRILTDDRGEEAGCCLYFHNPGKTAHVLNVLSQPGREVEVIRSMFADLEASGHVAARGISQPFLMNALMRSGKISFAHRGYFCMITDRDDVRNAAAGSDIYVGGLASESWSRLLTDFG